LTLKSKIDKKQIQLSELPTPDYSLLDLKIDIAQKILQYCSLCEHNCRINRLEGSKGYCRCGTKIIVSTAFEHLGEDPELVSSGTIFTCGCTMKCIHCQNWSISQWKEKGPHYTLKQLVHSIEALKEKQCRNINLVGGDPTSWLPQWLEVFKHLTVNIPIVWNSNAYYSRQASELLKDFADIYLLDFKYGSNTCSTRISDAPNYWSTATRNHLIAKQSGELIIRVLLLPSHLYCCYTPIITWISKNLPKNTRVNILFQYRPEWKANTEPELSRKLTQQERKRALTIAKAKGLTNIIT
jgi:putative pyruvate formate lyase activating enzyme